MPHFDRFDVCAAWYHFLSENHEGQFSEKYCRLCKLLTYYRPSRSEEFRDGISENARMILANLEEKNAS